MGRIKSNKLLKFSLIIFVYAVIFSFLLFNLPEYIYTEDIGPKNNIEPGENNESGDDEEPGENESGEDEEPGDDEEPGEEPGPEKNLKPHPIMKCSFPDIDTVNFDGSQSFDNDGTIVSYSWNFGDGNTGSGMTAAHTYSESGIYRVTLTVTDNDDLQNSTSRNVNIRSGEDEEPEDDEEPDEDEDEEPEDGEEPGPGVNLKPHPIMKCSFPDIDTVYLDGSDSFDTDGNIIYYHWDFGDGSTGSGVTAAHTYSESGIYRVTLTITDNEGLQNSCEKNVNIKSKKPHPIMQYTFSETDRATVNFDGSQSFDNDGTIVSYSWDFGDGNTGRGSIITHTFDTPGIYRVTLTVKDNDGLENSCEKNVNIKPAEDEEPGDDEEPGEGEDEEPGDDEEPGEEPGPGESKKPEDNKPEKSKEVKESKKPDNNKKPEDNKGAGKKDIIPAENAASAAGDIKHVENAVAVVEVPVPGKNKKPHAKIEYSFSKTNANTVYINGSGSFDADGTIIYYHWDFGDGNTESRTSSTHTYDKPGQYRITLTVTDNEGLMNSTSRTISIKLNKINNTDNNYTESAPHNNREEKIKNMGRNLNEFKNRKVIPPEEPGDLTLKINDMFKKLLNVKQDKNVDTFGININSIGELLDIQKITENHSLKKVIDLDELVDINYERDRDKYRDNISDKKIKLPEFLLNFWSKFKELVTL